MPGPETAIQAASRIGTVRIRGRRFTAEPQADGMGMAGKSPSGQPRSTVTFHAASRRPQPPGPPRPRGGSGSRSSLRAIRKGFPWTSRAVATEIVELIVDRGSQGGTTVKTDTQPEPWRTDIAHRFSVWFGHKRRPDRRGHVAEDDASNPSPVVLTRTPRPLA